MFFLRADVVSKILILFLKEKKMKKNPIQSDHEMSKKMYVIWKEL